jgi:uncharacterized protein YdcH (DUF465 family)
MHFHHPLLVEFAQHSEVIRKLRDERQEFRHLADQYRAIDRRVCRIERAIETATDQETETLKKERLWLKDQIYREILKAAAQPA